MSASEMLASSNTSKATTSCLFVIVVISQQDTRTKHGRATHFEDRSAMTQVDVGNWEVARMHIPGLPEVPLPLPAKPKDSARDCVLGRRGKDTLFPGYTILKMAAVRLMQADDRAVGDPPSGKISKANLVIQLEAKIGRKGIEKGLVHNPENLDALQTPLYNARSAIAKDEIKLETVYARSWTEEH